MWLFCKHPAASVEGHKAQGEGHKDTMGVIYTHGTVLGLARYGGLLLSVWQFPLWEKTSI